MDKNNRYHTLVEARKQCTKCAEAYRKCRLYNGQVLYEQYGVADTDQIGQWSEVQGNLDADILIVGQDWGDFDTYRHEKSDGMVADPNTGTNRNLNGLLQIIHSDIDMYKDDSPVKLFLTNSILCYKDGGMNNDTELQHHKLCSERFLVPLIDTIKPKIIILLGQMAFRGLYEAANAECTSHTVAKSGSLTSLVDQNPFLFSINATEYPVFVMFHPSPVSLNQNPTIRKRIQDDWQNVKQYILANQIPIVCK